MYIIYYSIYIVTEDKYLLDIKLTHLSIVPPHVQPKVAQHGGRLVDVIHRELDSWHDTPPNAALRYIPRVGKEARDVDIVALVEAAGPLGHHGHEEENLEGKGRDIDPWHAPEHGPVKVEIIRVHSSEPLYCKTSCFPEHRQW